MKKALFAFALLIQAASSLAVDQYGEIRATVDGNSRTWYVLGDADNTNSGWTSMIPGSLFDVSLWGSPGESNAMAIAGVLAIDPSVMKRGDKPTASDVTIQYLEGGFSNIYVTTDDGKNSVTVEELSVEGDFLRVSGSFDGVAYFKQNAMDRDVDSSRSVSIQGTFSVTLPEE